MRNIGFEPICVLGFVFAMLMFWPVLGPILGLCVPAEATPAAQTKQRNDDDADMAIVMAQKLIQQNLKAPKSATFPWATKEYNVSRSDRGNWVVSSYVDATNSFGAEVRTHWTIEMEQQGNQWRVVPTSR